MRARNLFVIIVIYVVCSVAWLVLGDSIDIRTLDAQQDLGRDVEQMFGPPITQQAPTVTFAPDRRPGATDPRPPDRSDIRVTLEHENRYRGLIWFSVFTARFDATYTIAPTAAERAAGRGHLSMPLPAEANIDALEATVDGRPAEVRDGQVLADLDLTAAGPATVKVGYTTAGMDSWRYAPRTRGLRNFRLEVDTNFSAIDYPTTGLSPTQKARERDGGEGLRAVWDYSHMLPARDRDIGVLMPSMPASGTLAARIATFAPVSLFFFLVVMVTIQVLRGLKLHPLNYLLIAAGFFAFHILLAYLVDHVTIHLAFWIAAAVSVGLVVSYLRLVLGARAALRYAGAAQMIYLVFFSYAFFWRGWTGLTIVIGAIVTLFLVMQLTGRVDWFQLFAAEERPEAPGAAEPANA